MGNLTRRDFIQKSTVLAAGAAIPAGSERTHIQKDEAPKIRRYKPFGKTGHMVGDISAGAGQGEPGLVEHQVKLGINLFDTGFQYPGHEEILGKILPKYRDKVFIVDKWDPPLVTPTVTKAELLEALDVSLKRLNTSYVDCMMLHGIGHPLFGDISRIQNPAIYEAYDEAKKMGKVRFTGASSCGPKVLEEMAWGIDNERFDVILLGANFLTHGLEPLLKKARAKGVATMAMKSMTIYKSDINIRGMVDSSTNVRQAVIKYVLASDLFDTMIISMGNYDQIHEYLSVSGTTNLDEADDETLETLSAITGTKYCRPGCDECYGSCPNDVLIWDVLRYKMYFENYGREKYAIERYRNLPQTQTPVVCADCTAPCEDACPHKLPVKELLNTAHQQLTLG